MLPSNFCAQSDVLMFGMRAICFIMSLGLPLQPKVFVIATPVMRAIFAEVLKCSKIFLGDDGCRKYVFAVRGHVIT